MLIRLTTEGREALARAVDSLRHAPDRLRAFDLFEKLPAGDRRRLLEASPADVFITAVRAWRLAAPGVVRDFQAGLLVLQSRRVVPTIAEAQDEYKRATQ